MYRVAFCFALVAFCWPTALLSPALGRRLKFTAPPSPFEDPPALLVPKRPRSEAEEDRITASALYAQGRMLLKRQEYAGALRRFERAWRYDPQAVSVLYEIIELAFVLKRNEEFLRYAVIAAERDPKDPLQLRRMAVHLTEQEQYRRALALYQKSLELDKNRDSDGSTVLIHLEMGRLYFLLRQFKKSAQSFAAVRDALNDPARFGLNEELKKAVLGDARRTYTLFAESFLRAGRLAAAAELFKKADQLKPDKGRLALQLGRIQAKRNEVDAALASLQRYFESGSSAGGTEPYELLAQLLKKKFGDRPEGQQALQARLSQQYKDHPNGPAAYYLAEHARRTGQWALAEQIYQHLLKRKATVDAYQGLIEVYRHQKKIGKLLEMLGQAVAKTHTLQLLGDTAKQVSEDRQLVAQLIHLARERKQSEGQSLGKGVPLAIGLLAIRAERFEASDEFFELALHDASVPPAEVIFTWGLDLFMAEQYERAARVFQRAIDDHIRPEEGPGSDAEADFHYYLASALEMSGKTDEAIRVAEAAVELVGQAARKEADRARALRKQSKRQEARAATLRAAELRARSPRFQMRVPWILYHAKRYEEAERRYRQLLERLDNDFSSPAVRQAMRDTRLALSNICVLQERLPEAEEWLEQVLDEFPEDIGALNDLGYLWADQNKHLHRALDMVRKAVEGEPDNVAYRDSLGWAYFRLGRYEEAVKHLERAAVGEQPDGVILDHLGDAYLKTDNRPKAIATWKKAIEAFKKQEDDQLLKKTQAKLKQHGVE